MSALARLAVEAGYRVSGTDRDDSELLARLREAGVDARAGHLADAVPIDTESVVISTAISPDNPELLAAVARGIAVLHRSDLLQELMSLKRGLAVAGAHGKSTTSALLALALGESSACVGAALPGGDGTGARWGSGPWFVAEADESDRSLLRLLPEAAILLNVDHDHHATYASLAEVEEVMREFVAAIPQGGALVVGPDARALACAEAAVCEVITVGDGGDYNVSGSGAGAIIARSGGEPVAMPLSIPGLHNAQNAACAVALAAF
jgi:UDP-N-acetylmuramate--alanine ligase